VKRPSFRARVLRVTLPPSALVLGVLVLLVEARDRRQSARALEGALALKWEEVAEVLAQERSAVELEAFLALESSYSSPTSEFYYELRAASGSVLAASPNLGAAHLGTDVARAGYSHQPHPLREGEEVLVLSGPLRHGRGGGPAAGTWASVALAVEPQRAAARSELLGSILVAGGGLLGLAAALWLGIGSSLRTVSAITREAAAIRSAGLRRRLPENGSGDELDRLTQELNGLLDGLEASFLQMEAFTSDAAHQLRTPLTRIRGEIDLVLASPGLGAEAQESLERTRGELERLTGTCGRLLLLARLDRGALEEELRSSLFDLGALACELVQEMRPLAEEAGIVLDGFAAGAAPVRGSRALCTEALLNLIENALRHTPRGGRIRVEVERVHDEVRLGVGDSGPGVPADERELVFRRFHRGKNAPSGGTGLGLSIVRGIARAHGGEASLAESARGALFQIRLPAA